MWGGGGQKLTAIKMSSNAIFPIQKVWCVFSLSWPTGKQEAGNVSKIRTIIRKPKIHKSHYDDIYNCMISDINIYVGFPTCMPQLGITMNLTSYTNIAYSTIFLFTAKILFVFMK